MKPIGKQPGKKPIKRRARTPEKKTQIRTRKFVNLIMKFRKETDKIKVLPLSNKVALEKFLEDRGLGQEQLTKLIEYSIKIGERGLGEVLERPPKVAISRKDEVLILKEMRRFLAAIEEAKNAGII